MSNYQKVRDATLKDPCCPFVEADFIRKADSMDVLDVMLVLEHLQILFARKYSEVTGSNWRVKSK